MNDHEEHELRRALLAVYRDLAQHGVCEMDDDIIELLWDDFSKGRARPVPVRALDTAIR